MFTLRVDDDIELRLHDMCRVQDFYSLIMQNKTYIGQWLGWAKHYRSLDDAREYVKQVRRKFAEHQTYATQIYYKGQIAGTIALNLNDAKSRKAEMGYWLGESFTGQGIVTRAARALLDFAFDTLNLHKVILRCEPANHKSCAVAERLGMTHVGVLVDEVFDNGVWRSFSLYRILQRDWDVQQHSLDFTKRLDEYLELRLFRPSHADTLYQVTDANRAHLRQWLPWLDGTTSPDDSADFIDRALEQYANYDGLQCGIWYEGQLCGAIGYHYWDMRHKKTEIGYWLAKSHTGKGIMTRCVEALIDYAVDVVGIHRIEIPCATGNTRSCAIPKRLGFRHEGVIRKAEWLYDHYVDFNLFAMLAPDWHERRG